MNHLWVSVWPSGNQMIGLSYLVNIINNNSNNIQCYWKTDTVAQVQNLASNLVPRAFSSFKMAVGDTPGQGCWNTPRIVEYFVMWHMMKWLFRRLFPASGGPVCFFALWNGCSIETKTFHCVYLTKFWWIFGAILAALARDFSDRHFEQGEGPGTRLFGFVHPVTFPPSPPLLCCFASQTMSRTLGGKIKCLSNFAGNCRIELTLKQAGWLLESSWIKWWQILLSQQGAWRSSTTRPVHQRFPV